jgi:hypothetical protein
MLILRHMYNTKIITDKSLDKEQPIEIDFDIISLDNTIMYISFPSFELDDTDYQDYTNKIQLWYNL